MANPRKVIIVGGGFGGLCAAQALKKAPAAVTLIDKRNFHLFQPLLYQVATGSLSAGEVAAPLRSVLSRQKNTEVLLGEVTDIDADGKRVLLADGAGFDYDSLIIATGSETSYYGHDEWREFAPSLKTVEEAFDIRHKILYAFEIAERVTDPALRHAWLTFVIVGAGPTGVELAGAIGEIARQTLKNDFRSIRPQEARIMLLDASPRVLMTYPEDLSQKAEASLTRLGIRVMPGAMVRRIDNEGVAFEHNGVAGHLASKTVIWAGGVAPSRFSRMVAERTSAETDKHGRLKVNPDLTIPRWPDIYLVGDIALSLDQKGNALPGVAQVAMQEGAYAAKAITRKIRGKPPLPPFRYFDKGNLAVIGRAAAVADIFGLHLSGLPAWLVWVFVHLMYLVEFQSRVLVFVQWAIQDITFSRGARLITHCSAEHINFDREVSTESKVPGPVQQAADKSKNDQELSS